MSLKVAGLEAKQKVGELLTDVRLHWKKPAKGNHVPYKEIVNYGIGGAGKELVGNLMGYFSLSGTNTLLAMTLGLRPVDLYYMSTILTVLSIAFAFIRGKIVDNTRTKWGRFRPYIAFSGFPVVAMCVLFLFLPFGTMRYMQKVLFVLCFVIAQSFLLAFYNDTWSELRTVMSPNSAERAKIVAISSIIYSISPTITGVLIPVLVDKIPGNYLSIESYRWVIAPIAIVGVFLSLFAGFGTKERTIVSKSYTPKVNIMHSVIQIFRNKYWWIRNIAAWIGFLEGFCGSIFQWVFLFEKQDLTSFGIIVFINGTAGLLSMVLMPILVKKVGNRNLVILFNFLNIFAILGMMFSYKILVIYILFNYFNLYLNNTFTFVDPVMHSEVKDYQQYISGKRFDFAFGAAGSINVPLTIATSSAMPIVLEYFGYTTNANIIFDPTMRSSLFSTLFILSAIGAFMNLFPLLFYNLTDSKHRNIVKVLGLRVMFEDYSRNEHTSRQIKENIDGINESKKYLDMTPPDIKAERKELWKALKSAKIKEFFTLRKKIKKDAFLYERIQASKILFNELNKFETEEWLFKLNLAKALTSKTFTELALYEKSRKEGISIDEIAKDEAFSLFNAKNMPQVSFLERKLRFYAIMFAKKVLRMSKRIIKNYPDGLEEFDMSVYDAALAMPETNKEEEQERKTALKILEKKLSKYNNTVRPYIEAKELLKQFENYKSYDEIVELYDNACIEVAEQDLRYEEEQQHKAQERKEEIERIKNNLLEKLSPEKRAKVIAKREAHATKNAERNKLNALLIEEARAQRAIKKALKEKAGKYDE
ncbi:MAG: MFS transporter [Christensenellaceae bacterium]|jgi:GPH family glycoside/pentoside/hexuronide:cation symporter/probable glucitol transport protein GutA|nr:MFS transporter [Christensenellaceae bacterium]